jgi:hypothetical protein
MKPTTSALHTLSALVLSAWFASTAVAQDLVKVAVPPRGTRVTTVADQGEQAKIFAKHGIKIESR